MIRGFTILELMIVKEAINSAAAAAAAAAHRPHTGRSRRPLCVKAIVGFPGMAETDCWLRANDWPSETSAARRWSQYGPPSQRTSS